MTIEEKKPFLGGSFTRILILLLFLSVVFIALDLNNCRLENQDLHNNYISSSVEVNFLWLELAEKKDLSSKAWDLNEWLPRRNYYMQQRFNALLRYNDRNLTDSIRAIDACLKELYLTDQNKGYKTKEQLIKECNAIGDAIDERFFVLLNEKVK